ncbi:MAG: signal peptidase I [Actinomycetota bacterium]|nr:signal peptidase I [Actinomycetota bacterium]
MEREQGNTSSGDDWIDDVLSRALEKSYNEPPKFEPDEKSQISTTDTDTDTSVYSEGSPIANRLPYPDENMVPKVDYGDNATTTSEKKARTALEWLVVIVGALLVAFLIKTFLMQAYFIPSSSMTPTLQVGDRVLVNKLSYDFGDISRGDLVVFKKPQTTKQDSADLIKRVIATEGELIEIVDGEIFITENESSERKLLKEPYLSNGITTSGFADTSRCETATENSCLIPQDHVFVMGDNRAGSRDSRYFGPVSESNVVGRAFIRIWPLGSLKLL